MNLWKNLDKFNNMDGNNEKILVSKQLIEEVCGALIALSMSNNGIEYIDKLCEQLEKEIKENE